jgi:hypothetical protein
VSVSGNHGHTPSSHRRYADWTIERIRRTAAAIGPATAALCDLILERRHHLVIPGDIISERPGTSSESALKRAKREIDQRLMEKSR